MRMKISSCGSFNLTYYSLKRLFYDPLLYGAILCVTLAALLPAWQDIRLDYEGLDVIFLFQYPFDIGSFSRILPLAAALTASTSYVADRSSGMLNFVLSRLTIGQYSRSRFAVSVCAGFLTLFLGWALYIASLSLHFPIVNIHAGNYESYCTDLYGTFLYRGHPVLYMMVQVVNSAICGGFWAAVGLAVSAYLPNRFVSIAAPFLINDTLYNLVNASPEKWHSPSNVAKGILVGTDSMSFMIMLGYFITLLALCYLLFYFGVKRGYRHA